MDVFKIKSLTNDEGLNKLEAQCPDEVPCTDHKMPNMEARS